MRRTIAITVLTLGSANVSYAQDICSGLLSYTGVDRYTSSRDNAVAASLYTNHCEGSSAKSGSQTSVGLEAVVESIPFKFNYGGSSSSERLNNFCKTYDSRRAEFASEDIDVSTVVRQALDAFNSCISLSASGIYFNPKIGRTNLVVDVRRGSDDAYISGVSYDPKLLKCLLPPSLGAAEVKSTTATTADPNSVLALSGNYVPISCERLPQDGANGEKVYPSAELSIGTSRGSFFMAVPADASLPYNYVSDISARMSIIESATNSLSARAIKCEKSESQDQRQYPETTAVIPKGTTLTGGGCMINDFRETGHNGTVLESRPVSDGSGWYCRAGDPPGIPLPNLRLTAYAVYCSIK